MIIPKPYHVFECPGVVWRLSILTKNEDEPSIDLDFSDYDKATELYDKLIDKDLPVSLSKIILIEQIIADNDGAKRKFTKQEIEDILIKINKEGE